MEAAVAQRPELFCSSLPYMQKAWDSTSLGLLLDCPYKYYLTIILGYQKDPMPPPLWFGIQFHKAIENYVKAQVAGKTDPLLIAITQALKDSWGYECTDNRRNRYALIRALVWYADHYKDSPAEVVVLKNGKPAVELSFRMPLEITSPDGDQYILVGHMDAVIKFAGGVYVNEIKTSVYALDDNFADRFTPDNQISNYSIASKVSLEIPSKGVIIDGIQTGVNFTRFRKFIAPRSEENLAEHLRAVKIFIGQAESYARAQYWPLNTSSCSKYGGCTFRECCAKAPSVRRAFLKSKFVVKPWNPLDNR